MPIMSMAEPRSPTVPARTALGAIAGPLFVSAFTVIGARRAGYDWRRHAVSSLAIGRLGWLQRSNFVLTGSLYLLTASGLARCPRRIVGPALVPALVGAAGVGLIGSGVFVTDPVAGFPPPSTDGGEASTTTPTKAAPSRSGTLHNLFAIPVFVGIPLAGMLSAVSSARSREYRWAGYSVGSSLVMAVSCVRFGAAFAGAPSPVAKGGIFQRISIAAGFAWLSALSLRAFSLGSAKLKPANTSRCATTAPAGLILPSPASAE
ncbi:MAG: DUF998 domain-containing protein [Acidimicrobiales bacterium]|jgi:hypothetical protein